MNKEIDSILLQFKTAIDFAKSPSKIKYDFEINDAEKLYDYVIYLQKENQRVNNVLNEIKIIIDNYYAYDYEDENLERLNVIDKINSIVFNELKESDK